MHRRGMEGLVVLTLALAGCGTGDAPPAAVPSAGGQGASSSDSGPSVRPPSLRGEHPTMLVEQPAGGASTPANLAEASPANSPSSTNGQPGASAGPETPVYVFSPGASAIYRDYGLLGLEKQVELARRIGSRDWEMDREKGTITFSDETGQQVFGIQVLGTETYAADGGGVWTWAWADTKSNYAERVIADAKALQQLGAKHAIVELTTPECDIQAVDGHFFSIIACGLSDAEGYFRALYEGGAAFVLLRSPPPRTRIEGSSEKIIETVAHFVQLYPTDIKQAVINYLQVKGYMVSIAGKTLTATHPMHRTIVGKLADDGTLDSISVPDAAGVQ
jgi:hypothetical protein